MREKWLITQGKTIHAKGDLSERHSAQHDQRAHGRDEAYLHRSSNTHVLTAVESSSPYRVPLSQYRHGHRRRGRTRGESSSACLRSTISRSKDRGGTSAQLLSHMAVVSCDHRHHAFPALGVSAERANSSTGGWATLALKVFLWYLVQLAAS